MHSSTAIPGFTGHEQLALYREFDGLTITPQPIADPSEHSQLIHIEFNRGKRRYLICVGRSAEGQPLISRRPFIIDRKNPDLIRSSGDYHVEQILNRFSRKVLGDRA